jgi:error-prone DNA polymerase
VREVGKALGLPEDVTAAIAGQVWGWSADGVADRHVDELNLDKSDPRLALALELARQLIGTPRHLSQHPGGFVLTRERLDDLVPIEPAAMEQRQVVEWEKDDIEELRIMKVDVLGLGMLGCMRRAFELLAEHKGKRLTLASDEMQKDDPKVYEMIQRADTLGVFQIESRAQMSMLPRLKPKEFYDIVIQVAIVRPGPIQGDMVHPYLRRREGKEPEEYPSRELKTVLKKTLGVPLFQEQAMKVAIVGAGFTPAEADRLRRAMATFKYTGGVTEFRDKMVGGMLARGYTQDFAERTFKQIEGFGSYGFPESHAASFAKIAYASSWMKCHHPDIFCAALLNAQPMGFYAPAQIVRDAQEHGVEVRAVCINESRWDCMLEERGEMEGAPLSLEGRGLRSLGEPLREPRRSWVRVTDSELNHRRCHPHQLRLSGKAAKASYQFKVEHAPGMFQDCRGQSDLELPSKGEGLLPLRLGLRMVRGLANDHAAQILAARAEKPFTGIEDVWLRSGVPLAALEKIADADAFACFGLDRRKALWQVRGLGAAPLPLFAAADAREEGREPSVALAPLAEGREVFEDYRTVQLSLRAHPMSFLRPELDRRGIVRCADLAHLKDGRRVEVAGVVLIRQRPGTGSVTFITIEDESGIANAILWQSRFEAQRRTVMSASMIGVKGIVQREGNVIHVVTARLEDYTSLLHSVADMGFAYRPGRGDGATHPGSPDRGERGWLPKPASVRAPAVPSDVMRTLHQKTRDFH